MANIKLETVEGYFANFFPHICVYSFNGVGKTTFGGETGLRTIYIDCGDAGAITLRKLKNARNIRLVRVTSTLHFLDVMDECNRLASSGKLDLVVIDTLTGLQSRAIKEVKGKRGGEMNQRKWGQVSSKVIECISETRVFPRDVIYFAQQKSKNKEDEEGNTSVTIAPSLTPSVREFMSGQVDWVGRLYIHDGKRKMSFQLTEEIECKDRGSTFPKVIVNPAYPAIRKRIMDSLINQKGE